MENGEKARQQGRSERKPDVYFPKIEDWNGWATEVGAGCSKRFPSAAAASAEARRTLRYVESLSDARTKLEAVFNTLPSRNRRRCLVV